MLQVVIKSYPNNEGIIIMVICIHKHHLNHLIRLCLNYFDYVNI